MDTGDGGKRGDFEATAAHLLPYDPAAKKQSANTKRPHSLVSDVEGTTVTVAGANVKAGIFTGTLSLSMPNCLLLRRKNFMSGAWLIPIKPSHPKIIKVLTKGRARTSFTPRNSFHPWFLRRSSLPLTKNQRRRRGRMAMQPTSCPLCRR